MGSELAKISRIRLQFIPSLFHSIPTLSHTWIVFEQTVQVLHSRLAEVDCRMHEGGEARGPESRQDRVEENVKS
jgi:hypothetical protein